VVTREVPAKLSHAANARPGKLALEPKAEILGLELRDAQPVGATVAAIVPDGPADRAKLRADDVILEVGGRTVRDAAAAAAAIGDRQRAAPGESVGLLVERKGKRSFIVVTPD
jgi:S1-C subfamily serine protease